MSIIKNPITREVLMNAKNIHSRLHAKSVDKYLGFKIAKIEVKLLQKFRAYDQCGDDSNRKQHYQGTQAWIGLHPQVLQTPYCEILDALNILKDKNIEHVVDIGAGYGRVGIVLSVAFPDASFTGFEIIEKRQAEGNRVFEKYSLTNSNIENTNVLDLSFDLPKAQVYFIYDFSEREDIDQILTTLSNRIDSYEFYLIVRGDRINYLMKSKYKNIWKKKKKVPSSDLVIYSS